MTVTGTQRKILS